MEKILSLSIIAVALTLYSCGGGGSKITKNSLEESNIKGKVKQITEFIHPDNGAMMGAPTPKEQQIEIIRVTEYSPEGYITQIRNTNPQGSYIEKHIYNADNLLTSVEFVVDTTVMQHIIMSYNKKGLRSSEKIYDKENKLVQENTFEHDKNGHVSKITRHNPSSNKEESITIVCDVDGKRISSTSYYQDSKPNVENTYKYNSEGDILSSTSADKLIGGEFIQFYSYDKYDQNKNWLSRTTKFNEAVVETVEREIEYYN